jgi:hypothetical protein
VQKKPDLFFNGLHIDSELFHWTAQ